MFCQLICQSFSQFLKDYGVPFFRSLTFFYAGRQKKWTVTFNSLSTPFYPQTPPPSPPPPSPSTHLALFRHTICLSVLCLSLFHACLVFLPVGLSTTWLWHNRFFLLWPVFLFTACLSVCLVTVPARLIFLPAFPCSAHLPDSFLPVCLTVFCSFAWLFSARLLACFLFVFLIVFKLSAFPQDLLPAHLLLAHHLL